MRSDLIAGGPPGLYDPEAERRVPALRKKAGREVVVGDGVPPHVQSLQMPVPALVPRMTCIERWPKLDAQALEVATNVAGACVALVQHQAMGQVRRNQVADLMGNRHHNGIHAQDMEGCAEALELSRQEDRIGTIQLLSGKASPAIGPTDGLMSCLELIESPGTVSTPTEEG